MAEAREGKVCTLSLFERRLYCAKKRVSKGCLFIPFLDRRCPYLIWTKNDVIKAVKRGSKEIVALSGFTPRAVEYAERFRPQLRLIHRDRVIKPRRRKKRVAATTVQR